MENTKSIPLESRHAAHGAKLIPFAGYRMPVQYTGIKAEHHAVRTNVGLFDVSHMGEVEFVGPDAVAAVNALVTNNVAAMVDGQALYTAMCREDGGIVDDLVLYKLSDERVLVCVNASNREKDFAHMKSHVEGNVEVLDRGDDFAQLALQGPNAQRVLAKITGEDLDTIKYYNARFGAVAGVSDVLISRTGYTGEDGFELYIPAESAEAVFDALMAAGEEFELALCGLGCRDTLRLESKYLLYGNDMDESVNPVEAGLNWVVKLDGPEFVGREAIQKIKTEGVTRRIRGLILEGRGVLRPGYEIFATGTDTRVGKLTSGSFAPTLEESIGLGYIDISNMNDERVDVDIRGRRVPARVTKKPFYKRS